MRAKQSPTQHQIYITTSDFLFIFCNFYVAHRLRLNEEVRVCPVTLTSATSASGSSSSVESYRQDGSRRAMNHSATLLTNEAVLCHKSRSEE